MENVGRPENVELDLIVGVRTSRIRVGHRLVPGISGRVRIRARHLGELKLLHGLPGELADRWNDLLRNVVDGAGVRRRSGLMRVERCGIRRTTRRVGGDVNAVVGLPGQAEVAFWALLLV